MSLTDWLTDSHVRLFNYFPLVPHTVYASVNGVNTVSDNGLSPGPVDSAKPLSEPMLTYGQLDPKEHISMKFY